MIARLRPSRRAVLRGAGVTFALPALESLLNGHAARAAACAPPRRLLVYMVPNGMNMPRWVCTGPAGPSYTPSSTLQTIMPIRAEVLVINGLHNEPAIP